MSSLGGSCSAGKRSRRRRTVSIVSSTDRVVWESQTTRCGSRTVIRSTSSGPFTTWMWSGASVPEVLVQQVLAWLAERGYGTVDEVVTAEEDLLFSLPKELRRDLKAAKDARAAAG